MAKIRDFRGGNYLKCADLGEREARVTIESITPETIGEGDDAKEKLVARFEGKTKGLVLNDGNLEVIEMAFGPDTNDAIGGQIVLYVDPDVRYGGKRVGGIRIRLLPKKRAVPVRSTAEELDDEIPY
jgi:hypothetical protein